MFCPRCATQNGDGTKFCRQCGMKLAAVALALHDESIPATELHARANSPSSERLALANRREALRKLVRGGGLLTASALLGIALGIFSNERDWIIIWLVLVGWMAVWGVLALAAGIGAMYESKLVSAEAQDSTLHSLPDYYAASQAHAAVPGRANVQNPALPASVSEHTTELLKEPHSGNSRSEQ